MREKPVKLERVINEIDVEHGFYGWGLFEIDETGQPKRRMRNLHNSILETKPQNGGKAENWRDPARLQQ